MGGRKTYVFSLEPATNAIPFIEVFSESLQENVCTVLYEYLNVPCPAGVPFFSFLILAARSLLRCYVCVAGQEKLYVDDSSLKSICRPCPGGKYCTGVSCVCLCLPLACFPSIGYVVRMSRQGRCLETVLGRLVQHARILLLLSLPSHLGLLILPLFFFFSVISCIVSNEMECSIKIGQVKHSACPACQYCSSTPPLNVFVRTPFFLLPFFLCFYCFILCFRLVF